MDLSLKLTMNRVKVMALHAYSDSSKIFLTALAVKLVYLAVVVTQNPDHITFYDSANYLSIAENIVRGKGFASIPYFIGMPNCGEMVSSLGTVVRPDTFRTPLYPYFLIVASLGDTGNLARMVLFQALVTSATPVIVYNLARQVGRSRRMASIVAIVACVEPPSLGYSVKLMTESIFTLFLWTSVYYLVSTYMRQSVKPAVASALLLALAVLTRPIGQYIPVLFLIVLVALWLVEGRLRIGMKSVCVFAVVTLLPVGAWVIRNYQVSGVATLSTASASPFVFEARDCCMAEADFNRGFCSAVKTSEEACQCKLNIEQRAALLTQHTADVIIGSLPSFIYNRLLRVPMLLFTTGHNEAYLAFTSSNPGPIMLNGNVRMPSLWHTASLLFGLSIMVLEYSLFAVGLVLLARKRDNGLLFSSLACLITLLYLTIASLGLQTSYRFRVPMVPGILVIGSLAEGWVVQSYGNLKRRLG